MFEDGLADGPGMWASIVDGKEQPLVRGTSRISLSLTDLLKKNIKYNHIAGQGPVVHVLLPHQQHGCRFHPDFADL